jgi:hypothetical protein
MPRNRMLVALYAVLPCPVTFCLVRLHRPRLHSNSLPPAKLNPARLNPATLDLARFCSVALCAATSLLSALPCAADAGVAADATADWVPVAETLLDEARGGFDAGNGLLVALSVDRVLSLNGNVVASGQLAMDATALADHPALSTFQVYRVGEGSALVQAARPLAGLVLQNSANDQLIRSQTTIDATVNSLSILKDMHFGDSLRHSLSTAIVPR